MSTRTIAATVICLASTLAAQSQSIADRYLTGIAKQYWTERDAAVAKIRTPGEVEQRQKYVRAKFVELLGGFP